jgi:hypothetical protein
VDPEAKSFSIRLTASRLAKGLLAIPSKFSGAFPQERCTILVTTDNRDTAEPKSFLPYNAQVKECRIFGLGRWFKETKAKPGDSITVTVQDRINRTYSLTASRVSSEPNKREIRKRLRSATTNAVAKAELKSLGRATKKHPREVAEEELQRIIRRLPLTPRLRVSRKASDRNEGVPPWLRVLLEAVYNGNCQACSFTFLKRDGSPYFEIHHLDSKLGNHPKNLLVLCANCHAQFERARIGECEYREGWLRSVVVNNKRLTITQALALESPTGRSGILSAILFLLHVGCVASQL